MKALHATASARRALPSDLKSFEKLAAPVTPCLALMRRGRTPPHIGVFLRRRILHLNERGAIFQLPSMAAMTFDSISYYR